MTMIFRLTAALTLGALGLLAPSAQAAQPKKRPAATLQNPAAAIEARDSGHILGNPEAKAKLVEYISYTCSHCAEFARTGEPAIAMFVVPRGNVSFEIRHLLRDPIDLTATLLTHCGDAAKFPGNHEAIMARQGEWLPIAQAITPAQRTRWSNGTLAARWRAIASDLGFYPIMEARGYSRPQLDICLADQAKANTLAEATQRDVIALDLKGTPSFVLDGKLLDGVHNWDALEPVLEKLD